MNDVKEEERASGLIIIRGQAITRVMKGIILAGGKGTRLHPASQHVSKILLPVYDKPMIYYPLSTLMSAGIRDILIVTSMKDRAQFEDLLKDGSQFGVRISYSKQKVQRGIADALLMGEEFAAGEGVALILGDNIFFGKDLELLLEDAMRRRSGASVFCKKVEDPRAFGVAEIGPGGDVLSIEEKPENPKSYWAVTGLYIYDFKAMEYAKTLKPSARGEYEVTDLNRIYLEKGMLHAYQMGDGSRWVDTGTFDSILDVGVRIRNLEKETHSLFGSPEAVALEKGFVTPAQLLEWVSNFKCNSYYCRLKRMAEEADAGRR